MPIKAFATCDVCNADFTIQLVEGRRGLHEPWDLNVSLATNTGAVAKRDSNDYGKGERKDDEIEIETVCEPCRQSLRKAFQAELARLKSSAKQVRKVKKD